MGYCPASNPYHPLVNLGRISIVLSTLPGRVRPPRVAREARRCRDGEAGRGLPLRDGGEPPALEGDGETPRVQLHKGACPRGPRAGSQ